MKVRARARVRVTVRVRVRVRASVSMINYLGGPGYTCAFDIDDLSDPDGKDWSPGVCFVDPRCCSLVRFCSKY